MTSTEYRGTLAYEGPDATIERLMPGFLVRLQGAARLVADTGQRDRTFGSWRAAVSHVVAHRTIAKEVPK